MPLHLLGKKSWNVYNSINIERVRKDEADAQAREEAEEQRLQLEDANDRIRTLRGEKLDAPTDEGGAPAAESDTPAIEGNTGTVGAGSRTVPTDDKQYRKRKRLYGEDDTDRDIRWAREDAEIGRKAAVTLNRRNRSDDAPIQDQDGHIQLVPVPDVRSTSKIERNAEAEAEKARKVRQEEDQYTMRFSNAAGYNRGISAPWYADKSSACSESLGEGGERFTMPAKDVWGNEDPRRRERESRRVVSNDPLAFMQQAQRQLKQSERDRDRWKIERDAETQDLERDLLRRRPRDSIPALDLDNTATDSRRHRHKHRRHRSRSPHRDDRRHRRDDTSTYIR